MLRRANSIVCALVVSVFAGLPFLAQVDSQSGKGDFERRKIDVTLESIPLRSAIDLVGGSSGLQYSINPNVPDVLVSLRIRDVSPTQALRMIVREASKQVPGLTVSKSKL